VKIKEWLRNNFLHLKKGLAINESAFNEKANSPVNFRLRDASAEALIKDVEYAYKIGQGYLASLLKAGISLKGLRAIEFGPGHNFGTALYLACHGMNMAVADRFLSPWAAEYHPLFYQEFLRYLEEKEPELCVLPIRKVLDHKGYPHGVLTLHKYSIEDMTYLPSGIFDVTMSNAVFEHLYDVNKAFVQINRLTAEDGMGFHQVDHRDHRDFSRPLEYLILPEEEFRKMFAQCHGECGNRIRPRELQRIFRQNGFEIIKCDENITIPQDYLEDFYPRLQKAKDSIFSKLSKDDLTCISCQYIVRKKKNSDLHAN
jgi:hypothetical protein